MLKFIELMSTEHCKTLKKTSVYLLRRVSSSEKNCYCLNMI